jgi:hypothetical protein
MTWTRLSDDFADRPEVVALSDAAWRAHVEALIWCNRLNKDGRVPGGLRELRRILTAEDLEAVLRELTEAGLWECVDDAYQLDWSEQEPAERVAARREQWRERDERRRRHNSGDHSTCDRKRCHYLIAHPEVLTRETRRESHSATNRDSHPPVPLPSRSRPEGTRERDKAGRPDSAGAPSAGRKMKLPAHAWVDDGSGGVSPLAWCKWPSRGLCRC